MLQNASVCHYQGSLRCERWYRKVLLRCEDGWITVYKENRPTTLLPDDIFCHVRALEPPTSAQGATPGYRCPWAAPNLF